MAKDREGDEGTQTDKPTKQRNRAWRFRGGKSNGEKKKMRCQEGREGRGRPSPPPVFLMKRHANPSSHCPRVNPQVTRVQGYGGMQDGRMRCEMVRMAGGELGRLGG